MDKNPKLAKMLLFEFPAGKTNLELGRIHGESFHREIKELAEIRVDLLKSRHPGARKKKILSEAKIQYECTSKWNFNLGQELKGIAEGSGLPLEDIVILNNYTDFRDLPLEEEACTTIGLMGERKSWMGQTWDMHQSAKPYVVVFKIPGEEKKTHQWFFSLMGCLGMAGVNSLGRAVAVNNINTKSATSSIIWPAIVRACLSGEKSENWRKVLIHSKPSSGHGYMLGEKKLIQIFEKSPECCELISSCDSDNFGYIIHTNHCLGVEHKKLEQPEFLSSTTYERFFLAENQITEINSFEQFAKVFKSHQGYPKSLCCHYQSNIQDPSTTCGGFAVNFYDSRAVFWKGCEIEDKLFEKIEINYNGGVI